MPDPFWISARRSPPHASLGVRAVPAWRNPPAPPPTNRHLAKCAIADCTGLYISQKKMTMPMLVSSGEKSGGDFLIKQGRMGDTNVYGVIIKGSGHWIMEEAPEQAIPALVAFVNGPAKITQH